MVLFIWHNIDNRFTFHFQTFKMLAKELF